MIENKYRVSIIVFNDDSKSCKKTLNSIRNQPCYQNGEVQLLLVWCPQAKEDETLRGQLAQAECETVYEAAGPREDGIFDKVVSEAVGTYLHITKAGVTYPGGSLDRALSLMEKNRWRSGVTMVYTSSHSAEMRELNAYTRDFGKRTDLINNFHLVHCNYYTYFMRRDAWTKESTAGAEWTLSVLKGVLYTIAADRALHQLRGVELRAANEQTANGHVMTMFREHKYREFYQDFLRPVMEYFGRQQSYCERNAKYNLLYYCMKMQQYFLEKDETVQREVRSYADETVRFIGDEEVLLSNPFLSRTYKHFLQARFSWKMPDSKDMIEKSADIAAENTAPDVYLFIRLSGDKMVLEGKTTLYSAEDFTVALLVNGERIACELSKMQESESWFGEQMNHTRYYKCEIPLPQKKEYRIKTVIETNGRSIEKESVYYQRFMPLANDVFLFWKKSGWLVYADPGTRHLHLVRSGIIKRARLFLRHLASFLFMRNNYGATQKALAARAVYRVLKVFKRKQIWLVSDRTNRGDDNGESFFRYLSEHPQPDVKAYYVIDRKCPDYERMKQYGEVVGVFSWKHKFLHLLCDYLVSSQANKAVENPFGRIGQYYRDIACDKPLAFLQHGVIKDDLSGWLNRYNKNLYGFVTTTKPEYQSILDYDYYYSPKEVWLTGLPRHDYLVHDEKNYITIMPTWRKTLTGGTNAAGEWQLGADFIQSRFFRFYNAILNDERLLAAAKKYGYTVCFFPHPNIKPALSLFQKNPDVLFFDTDKPYREVYAQSNLILTDYSSAVFDFAYLKKPIVYCQFDRDEFFSGGHSYVEGYYNYQTDGFGEVEETLEGAVNRLISYMQSGCKLKDEYLKRIEETFAYHDRNCCERVLRKLRDRETR